MSPVDGEQEAERQIQMKEVVVLHDPVKFPYESVQMELHLLHQEEEVEEVEERQIQIAFELIQTKLHKNSLLADRI